MHHSQSAVSPSAEVRYLGAVSNVVPLERCGWTAFISHHQAAGGGFVEVLRLKLEAELQRRGVPLWQMWTDMRQTPDEAGMREGVERSECFILFLTTRTLERDMCRFEIQLALKFRKPVLLVYHTDPREAHGNADFMFYANQITRAFPSKDDHEWLLAGKVPIPYDQRGGHDAVMVQDILKQMPCNLVAPTHPAQHVGEGTDEVEAAEKLAGEAAEKATKAAEQKRAADDAARKKAEESRSFTEQVLAASTAAGGVLVGLRALSKLVSDTSKLVKDTREIRDSLAPVVSPILAATHLMPHAKETATPTAPDETVTPSAAPPPSPALRPLHAVCARARLSVCAAYLGLTRPVLDRARGVSGTGGGGAAPRHSRRRGVRGGVQVGVLHLAPPGRSLAPGARARTRVRAGGRLRTRVHACLRGPVCGSMCIYTHSHLHARRCFGSALR
jgi:hypothetical protein